MSTLDGKTDAWLLAMAYLEFKYELMDRDPRTSDVKFLLFLKNPRELLILCTITLFPAMSAVTFLALERHRPLCRCQ